MEISFEKNIENESDFFKSKIATGSYYFNKILPKTSFLKDNIISGATNYNEYNDKFFETGFNL